MILSTSDHMDPQERCSFLSLPIEIRRIVYGYCLDGIESQSVYFGLALDRRDGNVGILAERLTNMMYIASMDSAQEEGTRALFQSVNTRAGSWPMTDGVNRSSCPHTLSLLGLCRIVNKEASDVLYSYRRFRALVDYSGVRFLRQITFPEHDRLHTHCLFMSKIKHLTITLEILSRREARMLPAGQSRSDLAEFCKDQVKANLQHLISCIGHCHRLQSVRLEMVWPDTRGIGFIPETSRFLDLLDEPSSALEQLSSHSLGQLIVQALSYFSKLPVLGQPLLIIATSATKFSHVYSLDRLWQLAQVQGRGMRD